MRKAILQLTGQCPVTKDNPKDCPLRNIRKLAPAKRKLAVEWLENEEVTYLTMYHHVCMTMKLAKKQKH